MRRATVILLMAILSLPFALAQSGGPSGQKTLAATLGVYVFPAEGQEASQQSKDEADCYEWAVGNTGVDPFDTAKQAESEQRQAEKGQRKRPQRRARTGTRRTRSLSVAVKGPEHQGRGEQRRARARVVHRLCEDGMQGEEKGGHKPDSRCGS